MRTWLGAVLFAALLSIGSFAPVEAGIGVRVVGEHYIDGHYYPSYGWYHRGAFYRHYPGHYYSHGYYRPYYYYYGGYIHRRPHYYYGYRPGFSLQFNFGKKHYKRHDYRGGRHGKHRYDRQGRHRRHHRR